MVENNINNCLSDTNCIGIVENVDTRKVVVGVENEEVLNTLKINDIVVLGGSNSDEKLIGILTKVTKKKIEFEGFSREIDMDVFDDVKFFEIIDKLEENPSLNIDVVKMAFGEDGYKALSDYFIKRDGKLKMSVIMSFVAKMFEESDPKDSASGDSEKTTQKS